MDLKPHNILVDKNWIAKVAGSSSHTEDECHCLVITDFSTLLFFALFLCADFGLSRVMRADKSKGQAGSPGAYSQH